MCELNETVMDDAHSRKLAKYDDLVERVRRVRQGVLHLRWAYEGY